MEQITLLHTNDLHSHLDKWPRIRRYLLATQAQKRVAGHAVYTFDIGDNVDRVHTLSEASYGQQNVRLMNQANYDAVTIGNNEGLGFTKDQLDHLYDHANFPVILGNLVAADTAQAPAWAVDHRILTTALGTKILVLGFTAPYELTYPLAGWHALEVVPILTRLLHQYRQQVDLCVVLSHLGLDVDRQLARRFSELDVIIGSHTHHLLPNGERVHHSLLAAAGKFGQYVGQVTLKLDKRHHLQTAVASVIATAGLTAQAGDNAEIQGYTDWGDAILKEQRVANLPIDLPANVTGHPQLVQEGLHAVAEYAGTQAAILNAGLFLTDLPRGIITQKQLHDLLPHSMHVMIVTLDGYNLWRLIQECERTRRFLRHYPQRGMGFRGKVFGELNYLGINYDPKNKAVTWRGEPLSPVRQYRLAVLDHYLFVPFFPTIAIVGHHEILYQDLLREVFAQYLAKHYPLR